MYKVSKLSRVSLAFISTNMAAGKTRTIAFSIAAAYVLSSSCSLPSGDVKDVATYFSANHAVQIERELDTLNDFCSIDTKAIRAYVKSFYRLRCEAISPRPIPLMLRDGKGIIDMFSLGANFPEEVLTEINDNATAVMNFISGLSAIFTEIRKVAAEVASEESSGTAYAA